MPDQNAAAGGGSGPVARNMALYDPVSNPNGSGGSQWSSAGNTAGGGQSHPVFNGGINDTLGASSPTTLGPGQYMGASGRAVHNTADTNNFMQGLGISGFGNRPQAQSPYGPGFGMSAPGGMMGMGASTQGGWGGARWGGRMPGMGGMGGQQAGPMPNMQAWGQMQGNPQMAAVSDNFGGNQYGRQGAFGQSNPYGMSQMGGFGMPQRDFGGQPRYQQYGMPQQGNMGGAGNQQPQYFASGFNMPQQNYTMRGSMPSFGSLGGGPFAFQNMASQFPQFQTPYSRPQYGQNFPRWNNNWQMDANGYGVPLPAGQSVNQPVPAPATDGGGGNTAGGGNTPQTPVVNPGDVQWGWDQPQGA